MPEEELVRLGRILKPLRRWKRYYDREDVDDGWEWEIDYCFGGISIQTAGHESAPPFFNYYEKKLGKMLDAQYEAYGKDRQITLEEVMEKRLSRHIEGLRMDIEDLRNGSISPFNRIVLKTVIRQNQELLEIEGEAFLDELSDQELADVA